jgi:hypothetical protein
MRMRRALALTLMFLGLFLAYLSLNTLVWHKVGFLESGTYELLDCNTTYVKVTGNGSVCLSLYRIDARKVAEGSNLSIKAKLPMVVASNDVKINGRSYKLVDGATLLFRTEELNIEGKASVYDINLVREKARVEEEGGWKKVYCAPDSKILLSGDNVRYEAQAHQESMFLPLGLTVIIAGLLLALLRRGEEGAEVDRSGEESGAGSSTAVEEV